MNFIKHDTHATYLHPFFALPEEVPPLWLLEDVWDDAGEEARAVQHPDLLLLRPARGVRSQHQLLHRLLGK